MWHRAKDIRLLLFGLPGMAVLSLSVAWVSTSLMGPSGPPVTLTETRIEVAGEFSAEAVLEVRPIRDEQPGTTLMGVSRREDGLLSFEPALPLMAGQVYQMQWRDAAGKSHSYTTRFMEASHSRPSLALRPMGVPLPSNALKLYLHFSQPMEQGVFLDKLRLTDDSEKEVIGPFRETELWSPDGKRLTLWFHPGRQKTGVNLNEEEGPVLVEGRSYTLHVAGTWRSEKGVAIGEETTFHLVVGKADHELPDPSRWKLELPRTGSRDALRVTFDEPLDTAMLADSLNIQRQAEEKSLTLNVTVHKTGLHWSAEPSTDWVPGNYELLVHPLLEDLAGNSLTKSFEVNLMDKNSPTKPSIKSRPFTLP